MRRRKRSFEEQRGNHREFLEESWHADLSDHRSGLLTRDELHARWFGSDAIAWLKQLFTVEVSTSPITHSVSETLNVILLDETYQCTISDVDVSAKLLVEAQTSVDIDTSFGLTMIATLGIKVDLSGSYLWFKNSGTVEALFMIDALVSAQYDTGDVELFGLENFGATFAIPGIVTVGPNFKLGQFEAHVALADWDTQLAFPDQESDADSKSTDSPGTNGTQEVSKPTIDWSVNTNGQITAHVKPVASFGIDFNSNFISVPSTTINLVADGWVTAYASAVYSPTDADFCYGANVGASLYVSLDVPPPLQWALPGGVSQYPLWSSPQHAIIEQTCSATEPNTTSHTKRDLLDEESYGSAADFPYNRESRLNERSVTVGPLLRTDSTLASKRWKYAALKMRQSDDDDDTGERCIASYPSPDDDQVACTYASYSTKRDLEESGNGWSWPITEWLQGTPTENALEKRLTPKTAMATLNSDLYTIEIGQYKECAEAQRDSGIDKNFLFDNSGAACIPNIVQLTNSAAKQVVPGLNFERSSATLPGGWVMPSANWVAKAIMGDADFGTPFKMHSAQLKTRTQADGSEFPINVMTYGFGRSDGVYAGTRLTKARTQANLALLVAEVSGDKGTWFRLANPAIVVNNKRMSQENIRNAAGVFNYLAFAPPGGDAIWNKWMRVSNWIDLTCYVFDTEYQ
ncbi:glycosyl hydrolase family 18 [Botrytis cinerea]